MADWHETVPAGNVLDIHTGLDRPIAPPRDLVVGSRVSPGGRRVISFLSGLVALGSIVGAVVIWRVETPGLGFDIPMSALAVLFGLGFWAGILQWRSTADERDVAIQAWRQAPPVGPPHAGLVVDRNVSMHSEASTVDHVELLVEVAGTRFPVSWRSRGRKLLESQVPGIGSQVRVWQSPEGPIFVQADDPTVVRQPSDRWGQ